MSDRRRTERRLRILFLFSDTGGGHRSATEAMMEALRLGVPRALDARKVDFFREYYPRPLRIRARDLPADLAGPAGWGLSFKASDGRAGPAR